MKAKEKSGKVVLKLNIQKTKIMASGLITSWQMKKQFKNGNSVRLYFFGFQITADSDCSHEIKKHLLLGRKAMTNLDSRDITLPTTVQTKSNDPTKSNSPMSQSYGFSRSHLWMWELDYKESWELKNWCFWTVVMEKIPESPLGHRNSNQSILKKISSEYSLEGLMLKLKFQYFVHLVQRTDSFEKTLLMERLKAGGEGDDRGSHHLLDGHEFEQAPGAGGQWGLMCCSHVVAKSQTGVSSWTELIWS